MSRVKEVREQQQCSLQTAIKIVRHEQLEQQIRAAQTIGQLKDVLLLVLKELQ